MQIIPTKYSNNAIHTNTHSNNVYSILTNENSFFFASEASPKCVCLCVNGKKNSLFHFVLQSYKHKCEFIQCETKMKMKNTRKRDIIKKNYNATCVTPRTFRSNECKQYSQTMTFDANMFSSFLLLTSGLFRFECLFFYLNFIPARMPNRIHIHFSLTHIRHSFVMMVKKCQDKLRLYLYIMYEIRI